MDSKTLALICRDLAENKKAENIVILDVRKISSITDYFVVVSGSTEPHLRAIVSEITDRLRDDHQVRPRAIDGDVRTPWQVVDYFDVIVHIMRTDLRLKYNLESLWGDAPRLGSGKPAKEPKAKKEAKPAKEPKAPKQPKALKSKTTKAKAPAKPRKKTPAHDVAG